MRRLATVLLAGAIASSAALVIPTLSAASPRPAVARPWAPVKGIAIALAGANKLTDAKAMKIGSELFAMIADKFHANAVSLNFPFYQSGSRTNDPQRAPMTPSPGRLAMLTELAHRYHLSVQYRPYLWERNLRPPSRPQIRPSNVSLWFQNYWTFLEPYLESANQAGASSFSVALEFTTLLPYLSAWERIVQRAKTVYSGQLFYSQQHLPQETLPLTARGYDAYQPIPLKSDRYVSVAAFAIGFVRNFQMAGMQATPGDLTVEELGIPAVSGAYLRPNYYHYSPSTKVLRAVQTDWFAGACNAFRKLHLAGLYYWSIDFNTFTPGENSSKKIYDWLATPSATAIQSCFARTP
jgi:hypothetical protein